MRLQIRPNGPPLLAPAWAASRSRSWAQGLGAPAPVEKAARLVPSADRFPSSAAQARPGPNHTGLSNRPRTPRFIVFPCAPCGCGIQSGASRGGLGRLGGAGGPRRWGLGWALLFSAALFGASRRSPPPFFPPPRAGCAAADRIGALPSSFSSSARQARAESGGGKRGKGEKAGKEAMLAAEGLRETRKEWRGGEASGIRKAPNNRGLQTKAAPKHTPKGRDRPPSA